MLRLFAFLTIDFFMELVDAVIALLIGYFAFKGFRVTKEKIFLYLHFSFTLLGVGLLAHGLTTRMLLLRPSRLAIPIVNFGYIIYFITELIAYSLLIFAYIQQTRSLVSYMSMIAPPALIQYNPVFERVRVNLIQYNTIFEVVIFCLTAYITVQCAVNYGVRRDHNSLLVSVGFALIAASHAVFPLARSSGILLLTAHTLQLIGFASLLAMLLRVSYKK